MFVKGDNVVTLHTAQPDDEQPLVNLDGLEQLTEMVKQRLA